MPTLSNLCSSCHSRTPQYRCPRCSARTCSLACVKIHKTRTLCSGVRDPGAYASRAQLNNSSAFDRDYNFISGVERGIERAARDSEIRGIQVKQHGGNAGPGSLRGGRKFGGRGGGRGGGGVGGKRPKRGEVPLIKSFERDGINVVKAPKGMSREKQNQTHWRRKGGGVSWTVEWIELEGESEPGNQPAEPERTRRGTTQLHEGLTLREGFLGWKMSMRGVKRKQGDDQGREQYPREQEGADKKQTSTPEQSSDTAYTLAFEVIDLQRSTAMKNLLPFDSSVRLKDLLRGRTVREFPSIYCWPSTVTPDQGYEVLEQLYLPEPVSNEQPSSPTQNREGTESGISKSNSVEQRQANEHDEGGTFVPQDIDGPADEADEDTFETGHFNDNIDEEESQSKHNNEEEADEEEDDENEREEEGEEGIEQTYVGADSNLGISAAIKAALRADGQGV